MAQTRMAVRLAGTWFATASLLMVAVFAFHGPIAHDLSDQMHRISAGAMRWTVVHWIAAAALSLHAVTGLVVLAAASRLTERRSTMTAWSLLVVSALWTVLTAVLEATVVASAAISGNIETFEPWWAFAAGMANGFAFFALAVVMIAADDARSSERVTPVWSARVAMAAGVVSFAGWGLGTECTSPGANARIDPSPAWKACPRQCTARVPALTTPISSSA